MEIHDIHVVLKDSEFQAKIDTNSATAQIQETGKPYRFEISYYDGGFSITDGLAVTTKKTILKRLREKSKTEDWRYKVQREYDGTHDKLKFVAKVIGIPCYSSDLRHYEHTTLSAKLDEVHYRPHFGDHETFLDLQEKYPKVELEIEIPGSGLNMWYQNERSEFNTEINLSFKNVTSAELMPIFGALESLKNLDLLSQL